MELTGEGDGSAGDGVVSAGDDVGSDDGGGAAGGDGLLEDHVGGGAKGGQRAEPVDGDGGRAAAATEDHADLVARGADGRGVAIIATHSPVVLQEVPRTCVWKLRRSGSLLAAAPPEIETFGENVGVLTREAFGLEVTRPGFHREIQKVVDEGLSYDEIIGLFSGQLGGEAHGIARPHCGPGPRGTGLMWHLPRPGQTARDTYLTCISRISHLQLQSRMSCLAEAVAYAEELYVLNACATSIPSKPRGRPSESAMSSAR
jgi:hypothetical protein